MKSALLFLIVYGVTGIVHRAVDQQGLLQGTVRDGISNEEIDGANIFLQEDHTIGTASDASGNFTLSLSSGKQTLICSYLGYLPDTFTVFIEDGKNTTYNILLEFE